MFWKIIFYIWIFCTVFNLGECLCVTAKLNRKYGKNTISKSGCYERLWTFIKLVIICALPISNFVLFLSLIFDSAKFQDACEQNAKEKINGERKENT